MTPIPRWVENQDADTSSYGSEPDEEDDIFNPDHQDVHFVQQRLLQHPSLQGDLDLTHHNGPSTSMHSPSRPMSTTNAPKTPAMKLSLKPNAPSQPQVCHVCGQKGHKAGFVGAVYHDCINKPCYLCGTSGHSTATCPHRIAPELACTAASDAKTRSTTFMHILNRERHWGGRLAHSVPPSPPSYAVDAAVLKLHNRRCTCLEFHPYKDNIVVSGDKSGQIAIWDVSKVFERTVYTDLNKWLTNNIRFLANYTSENVVATTSYEGTVKLCDLEVGVVTKTLVDANPSGWSRVVEEDKAGRWVTFLGLDATVSSSLVVAGDSKGRVYFLDPRMNYTDSSAASMQIHKKNTKVQSVCCHPVASDHLVLTAGNDYHARLIDLRRLSFSDSSTSTATGTGTSSKAVSSVAEVASFAHPRVINSAYFSPITGRRIVTTCQDNRIRVWDDFTSNLGDAPSDREIVHSHNFNRHLTPFKAEWDPKDPNERCIVIGRYISDEYGGVALHPVDMLDAATGAYVGELVDPNLTTICPVNKPHPRLDLIITGSSRSLYAWAPTDDGNGSACGSGSDSETEEVEQGRKGGTLPLGSSTYIFFDADGEGKKKKNTPTKKSTGGGGTKTIEKEEVEEEDVEEDTKPANNKKKRKKKE